MLVELMSVVPSPAANMDWPVKSLTTLVSTLVDASFNETFCKDVAINFSADACETESALTRSEVSNHFFHS